MGLFGNGKKNHHYEQENKMNFKDGNKIIKEYAKEFAEKLDDIANVSDNMIALIATVDSENGESGRMVSAMANVSGMDLVKTLINVSLKNPEWAKAVILSAEYLNKHEDEIEYEDEEEDSLNALLERLVGASKNKSGLDIGAAIAIKNGKASIVDLNDEGIQKDMRDLLKSLTGNTKKSGREKVNEMVEKEMKKEVVKEEPAPKKKISMKKFLKGEGKN